MKIISQQLIRSLGISPRECVDWIYDSFAQKAEAQLPAKISVHPAETDFFTSMPCLLPPAADGSVRYFGVKEVHRIAGAVPSLGSDLLLYNALNGELLALLDADWITTMRTGAVAAVTARALRHSQATTYGFVGLGNTARATLLCALEAELERKFSVLLLRYKDQAEDFRARFADYGNVEFETVDTVEELATHSDVFFSCITSANGELISDPALFPAGATVIPVHTRGLQVCDRTFDRVFGDDTGHICHFKYFSEYRDYNEIGEVLSGRDPGRRSETQRPLAYNYGIALHDVFFAARLYERLSDHDAPNVEIQKETEKFWV